ncbi:MAG: hypothetical protein ACREFO_13245 [Acetobacteraceae bacterium]
MTAELIGALAKQSMAHSFLRALQIQQIELAGTTFAEAGIAAL